MSSQPNPVPRPWRRFLQFSVGGLIVLVIVIGAGLGWIVHQAHVQRDAVAAIKKAGGGIAYDWEWWNVRGIRGGKPWAPRWLVKRIGVDFFGHVTRVDLMESSERPDTALVEVGRLNKLHTLYIRNRSVTDAGLMHLKGLPNLSFISLDGTRVTDAGLVHLKGLTNLSVVRLDDTQVTDAGLVHLKGLIKLMELRLIDTHVTDAGLAHLKGLTQLSYLDLRGTQVTDAGVKELKRALPNLTIDH